MLIGRAPLLPLLNDPLDAELWVWTDTRTKEVSYAVTIEVMAREDLFGSAADPNMRIVGSSKFLDAAGKTVADAGVSGRIVSRRRPAATAHRRQRHLARTRRWMGTRRWCSGVHQG